MMSPEAFVRTHKRHVTDIVRVALEKKGVIGFIDVHDGMTLLEARTLIWENVEDAPAEFQFVLDDGAPVSARQEETQKIVYFYPMVRIRELRRGTTPSSSSSLQWANTGVMMSIATNTSPLSSSSGKVCVSTASGEEFHVWITGEYTFQQLRRDSARYWNIPASGVALADGEGCLWPEQAKILSLMSIEELHHKGIILEYKGGSIATKANSVSLKEAMGITAVGGQRSEMRRAISSSAFSLSLSPPLGYHRTTQSTSSLVLHQALSATECDAESANAGFLADPVEELWRIFLFYCVNGDSMELEGLKAHQFNKLLRDSRVFGGNLTPAMVDIIYTSETKGKQQASGKMNYDEFLNALVKVARTAHPKVKRSNSITSKLLCDDEEDNELFQRLIMNHILPLASRWPTDLWVQHTQRLRKPQVVSFMSKFLEQLIDMFMFYANSYVLNTSGVKEFYMSYADYQKFVNDFYFASLQVSSVEAAQVFLASCSSPPFHAALFETRNEKTDNGDSSTPVAEGSYGSAGVGSNASMASTQRILESIEGVVAYGFSRNQGGRLCMGVSGFLDAIGRTGLTAFTKTRSLKTIHCVKGMFHHLSRGLTPSRVLEIIKHHGSTSMHASKFYSGSVAFNNKFLDMWRYEGSPDYLTLDTTQGYSRSPDAKMMVSTSAGMFANTESMACSTGAYNVENTSRQVLAAPFTSSALFNDKVVVNGSGRGREALDRLVCNAFLRNAIAANDQNPSVESTPRVRVSDETVAADTSTCREPFVGLVVPKQVKEGGRIMETPLNFSENVSNKPVEKLDTKMHANTSFEAPAIDTRQVTLPEPSRSGPSPRSGPNLHLRAISTSLLLPHSPHSKTIQSQEDEKVFFESVLLKGGVFKKYGQWGNPHRRFVWCSKDFDAIYWRPLCKKNNFVKDSIAVASMVSILPGNSSRTRYAFMKHLSEERAIGRCFSVVAEDRRLDLEADSEVTCELWTNAFVFLMKEHRSRSS